MIIEVLAKIQSLRNSLQSTISHKIVAFRNKGWFYLPQCELDAVYVNCLPLPTRITLVLSRWCLIQLLSSMFFILPDTVKFKKPHPRSDERRCKAYYQLCSDGTASLITSLSFWLASYKTNWKRDRKESCHFPQGKGDEKISKRDQEIPVY